MHFLEVASSAATVWQGPQIAFQRSSVTRVAGFRRWLDLGYAVRKGEHGIRIWAPGPPSKRSLCEWKEGRADPEEKPRTFFRLVSVFDRSQVEPLPNFPGGPVELDPPLIPITGNDLAHLQEPLIELAASLGVTVSFEPIPGPASGLYAHERNRIVIDADAEVSANSELKTLVHELSHALVRRERREEDPTLTYPEEEVEYVAYTVCSSLGLDAAGYSVPCMTSWSKGGEIERYACAYSSSGSSATLARVPSEGSSATWTDGLAARRSCLPAVLCRQAASRPKQFQKRISDPFV
jgi:hypothetical protein